MIPLWLWFLLFGLSVAVAGFGIAQVRALDVREALIKRFALEKSDLENRLVLAQTLEKSDESQKTDLRAEVEALRALNETLQAQISTQSALAAELTHQNKTLDSKLTNTRLHIATCLQQRDFWNAWYHKQVSDHGAAQHLFMSELELHVKRGSQHAPNPVFRDLVNDFKDVHPALADQGKPPTAGGMSYPADHPIDPKP